MKKIILLLLISLSVASIHAQTNQAHKRDSLQSALQKEKTDSGRVLLLAELSFQIHEIKPDTAMILALEALELSRRIGFEKGEAVSLNRIGNVFSVLGNYLKALEAYLNALKINEKIENLDGKQRNLSNIGYIYFFQGDYRLALDYTFKAKPIAEELNNKISLSIINGNLGRNFLNLKNFDSATLYTQQAYNLAYQINYPRQIGTSSQIMGDILSETGQTGLALEYYRRSLLYLTEAENYIILSEAFLGIAKLFEKMEQKDSAVYYGKRSLIIAQENKFTKQVRDAGRFLTSYYRKINKADSAFVYLDITKAANDSLFNQQKNNQFQSLAFDEKLRQQEIIATELKAKEERKRNLQYAAIALGLITFVIIFLLLSHSIIANQKLIRFFGVVALLMVFEFINLYIHPYLSHATNDSPLLMLLVMVCIASLLVPVHHWLEKWITHQLVEKNNRIRLAAAKKTIQQLEGKETN